EDLSSALSTDFDFLGKPYYPRTYTAVEAIFKRYRPKVDGVDRYGVRLNFPLTETAVEEIIVYTSQAPFGKGEEEMVDKKVRDTWEIGYYPWAHQLKSYVLPDVCKGLGVPLTPTSPRLKLYKLLNYEPGGQ
ncbi:hypothetical protein FA15DRAFT_591712, partial [Coprinopsis marcescibilis]